MSRKICFNKVYTQVESQRITREEELSLLTNLNEYYYRDLDACIIPADSLGDYYYSVMTLLRNGWGIFLDDMMEGAECSHYILEMLGSSARPISYHTKFATLLDEKLKESKLEEGIRTIPIDEYNGSVKLQTGIDSTLVRCNSELRSSSSSTRVMLSIIEDNFVFVQDITDCKEVI